MSRALYGTKEDKQVNLLVLSVDKAAEISCISLCFLSASIGNGSQNLF